MASSVTGCGYLVFARRGDVEDAANFVDLGGDFVVGGRLDTRVQIVHLQHLDVRAELGVVHGEVRVHVEHARIGVAQEADAGVVELAHDARGLHPFLDLAPAADVVLFGVALGRKEQPGDHVELDAAAGKGIGDLRHAAGAAVGQPFAGVGVGIVQRRRRLQVEDEHGRLASLHRRQHLR